MSDHSIVEILCSKDRFKEELEHLDFPHPRTFNINRPYTIEQICKIVTYPCLVKPIDTGSFVGQYHVKAFLANDSRELLSSYEMVFRDQHAVIIQEWIPGPDENLHLVHAYFNKDSQPLGIFTFRRMRQYPLGMGNGTMCVAQWIPELASLVTDFIQAIQYQGIIDAELKYDPREKVFKFIEINPRPGWQTRLSSRCGVNIAYLAYLDAIDTYIPAVSAEGDGTKWVTMHYDIMSAFDSMRKGNLSFIDYIRSFSGRIEWALFAWDDLGPSFYAMKVITRNICRKVIRLITKK